MMRRSRGARRMPMSGPAVGTIIRTTLSASAVNVAGRARGRIERARHYCIYTDDGPLCTYCPYLQHSVFAVPFFGRPSLASPSLLAPPLPRPPTAMYPVSHPNSASSLQVHRHHIYQRSILSHHCCHAAPISLSHIYFHRLRHSELHSGPPASFRRRTGMHAYIQYRAEIAFANPPTPSDPTVSQGPAYILVSY